MRIIKSVGVLSVAKIMGLIHGALGLILMPLFLLAGVLGMATGGGHAAISGVVGMVLAVMIPVLYGGLGFIMGAISALLYNVFAKWAGGIEVEVQTTPAASYSL